MDLLNGDCTFQAKFDKVEFSENQKITGTFKPPPGRQFVVLLLGTADRAANDFDIDEALNDLGYIRKDSPMTARLLTAQEESERSIGVLEEIVSAIQESWTGPHRKAVHVAMNIALDNFKKELRKCES